jgi:hypothetical protein
VLTAVAVHRCVLDHPSLSLHPLARPYGPW